MNPLLQKTEAAIMAKVNPPQLKPVVQKLVDAGKKIMYSDQSRQLLVKELNQPGDQTEIIGAAVAKLGGILLNQSKGTAPAEALVPAVIVLLCEGLDFLEQAGRIKVTPQTLAACTKSATSSFLQVLGVTPERMAALVQHKQSGQAGAVPPVPTRPPAPQGIISAARGAM